MKKTLVSLILIFTISIFTANAASDPYWDNVTLLVNFDDFMHDESTKGMLFSSEPSINNDIYKFGGGSGRFGGGSTSAYTSSKNLDLGNGDFTIELWVRFDSVGGQREFLIDHLDNAGIPGWGIRTQYNSGLVQIIDRTGNLVLTHPTYPSSNTWHHVAVTRENDVMRIYLDGNTQSEKTYSFDFTSTGSGITDKFGYRNADTSYSYGEAFYGYMDDIRITKGIARYSGNFTAPTTAFPTSGSVAPVQGEKFFFNHTGDLQSWTVPAGITSVGVKMWGGAGGTSGSFTPSPGGYSEGELSVTPSETLYLVVAGGGKRENQTTGVRTNGGYGGGGLGGAGRSGGQGKGGCGGLSGIFTVPVNFSNDTSRDTAHSNALIVAGGGGPSGSHHGGGLSGISGGTQTSGGAASYGGYDGGVTAGSKLLGGDGNLFVGSSNYYGGGCGGGGYYGGGGGGSDRGGGGGSGYVGAFNDTYITKRATITQSYTQLVPPNTGDSDYISGIGEAHDKAQGIADGGNGLIVLSTGNIFTSGFSTEDGSTDLTQVSDLADVPNFIVGKANGKIKWSNNVNLVNQQLDNYVSIGDGFISVDVANLDSTFDSQATLSIKNVKCLEFDPTQIIYKTDYSISADEIRSGETCPSNVCSNPICTGNTLNFTVTGFSGYAYGANANLTVFDLSETTSIIINESVAYYAEYINATSGASITNTDGTCYVTIPDKSVTEATMTYDSVNSRWNYSTTGFDPDGEYSFDVKCNSTSFTNLNASDTVVISPEGLQNVTSDFGTTLLNIKGNLILTITDATIDLGLLQIDQEYSSENASDYFSVLNDGSVDFDLYAYGASSSDSPFTSTTNSADTLPNNYYFIHVNSSDSGSANETYVSVPDGSANKILLIDGLDNEGGLDSANLGIKVIVPHDEKQGAKSAVVTLFVEEDI